MMNAEQMNRDFENRRDSSNLMGVVAPLGADEGKNKYWEKKGMKKWRWNG
jgi:hypothetical protein